MEEEKFWTKTRIITIAVVVGIILIIVASILIHRKSMIKKYTILESQINNAAPNYISNEDIELKEENEYRKIPISALKTVMDMLLLRILIIMCHIKHILNVRNYM